MQKQKEATSIFCIPQIYKQPNYLQLYDKQHKMRIFYENETKQLKAKLQFYIRKDRHSIRQEKQQNVYNIISEIKSFKSLLPNSVKQISMSSSNHSNQNPHIFSLIKEFSIYGIQDSDIIAMKPNSMEEDTIIASQNRSQILKHTAKLVFPSGSNVKYYNGKEAYNKCLEIINISEQKLHSFILTFEPISNDTTVKDTANTDQFSVLNSLNPQRRVYAVCIALEDFTVINQQLPLRQNVKTNQQIQYKSAKIVRFKQMNQKSEDIRIAVSKRVYCIFSYYPFFSFYQEIIQKILFSAKVSRYAQFKENGQNLQQIDSRMHSKIIEYALKQLKNEADKKIIILDKLIDLSVGPSHKVYLRLTNQMCTSYLSECWSFPILSLFTLDVFLDVLTLMMLEEKIIFVCPNMTILTYTIFLFTRVLIHPFQYPYPVVNLIPDQEDYLQAPFPIVYGYNKTREDIIAKQLHKKYDSIFVFLEPNGIEIKGHCNTSKVLAKKSPQLRDRLIQKFKKMKKNYPQKNVFNFLQKDKAKNFQFPINQQLSKQIIREVQEYINTNILALLPSQEEIEAIRTSFQEKQIEENQIDTQIHKKIKQICIVKSKDPFFAAFLETQIINVYLFKN